MLNSLISSKTRLKLLIRFFLNLAKSSHLRRLASDFNESTNSIRLELNNLSGAGYLIKKKVIMVYGMNLFLYKKDIRKLLER